MGKHKTLLLIDGHALAFREYYALERTGMKTSSGQPTWAVFGFFKAVFDLLKNSKIKTDAIAVTFDVSHQTFRVEKYEKYKSNRQQMPDNMRSQMDLIYDGLRAFNIPIYTKEGYEADDVIGTISKKACELGHKVLILTGDQDAFQLIDKNGCVKVILPSKGELKEFGWEEVFQKLGVYPDQIIDYKALRGDTSDCIPGIRGIGEKTAQVLLKDYGNLENVLAHVDEIKQKSLKTKLETGVEDAKLSYFLATIIRDLDINFNFETARVELPDITKVTEYLKQMQFHGFIKNINQILSTFSPEFHFEENVNVPVQPVKNSINSNEMQLGLFEQAVSAEINKNDESFSCKLVTNVDDLNDLCAALSKQKLIALNIKSEYKNAVESRLIGISVAYKNGLNFEDNVLSGGSGNIQAFYIPLSHSTTPILSYNDALSKLKPLLESADIKKTTYDVKNDYNVLKVYDIDLNGVCFDVQLASYVKNPSRRHDLDIQSIENIDHVVTQFASPVDIKKEKLTLENVNIDNVMAAVCDEAYTIINLTSYWIEQLQDNELKVLDDIELPLAKVLARMEQNGVAIDDKYLNELSTLMQIKIRQIESNTFTLSGSNFNVNSPKQVSEVLFDKLGLKTKKRKKSTGADVLEELAEENEVARLILEHRKLSKLKSTYTDALPALISLKDNRIHTTFNQTVTATGRLSSSNPNLQNIPARTETGNKIRAAFVPKDRENSLILSADYSQIELRLLAHISKDKHLIEAFNNDVDVHTLTASKVFEVPISKVTKAMRIRAKAVNFGIIYGQSKYGLAKAIGISNSEAEDFINKYFETYPNIKLYMESTVQQALEHGYVETVFGRRRYLKAELESPNGMIREFAKRAAINQPIQGTAADLMKIAMIDFEKKLEERNLKSKMIMQVHDELVIETLKDELDEVTELVRTSMELNQPLNVPLVVDINTGETWKE